MTSKEYYDSRRRRPGNPSYQPHTWESFAIGAGFDVKLSEVHGMAQRGGSVVTFVRYGEKVAEPIVRGRPGRRADCL